MAEFGIIRYKPSMKDEWDAFIKTSKNGTFLFMRGYMDYHADRFPDHSLLFTRNGKLYALLPATSRDGMFLSHSGLTYGGMVTNKCATTAEILELFLLLKDYLISQGFHTLVYKPTPHIYHILPAEEDRYALFRLGGILKQRCVSSSILQSDRVKFRDIRKAGIRKAIKEGIYVEPSTDFLAFWSILTDNLSRRHGVAPVHSLEEIVLLASRFPENIKLYVARKNKDILAGVLMYVTRNVAHSQYISTTDKGRQYGALDLVFQELIHNYYPDVTYFDFGISTERGGHTLNESLIYQKEGFGGRAICYDTYELPLIPENQASAT